ncbi:MAG: 4-hydroxy-tetrahydrodipicolinate synthase [Nitrospirae bacterium]|nr:4-hydroxy-tetrahydrodipicolinate synthase [Nitrospirota bacterium]
MFEGSIVAIVTPFKKGKVDEPALKKLVEWHIKEGTDAIVPCGTTGESATLDYDEHINVIDIVVKTVNKRIPVIAGTGANATDETIMITKRAMEVGADGALLVSPYYNKPTQEGLFRHYKAVADAVKKFPLVLYNVPGRTAMNMIPSTVARLAEIKNIVAIKEATGDMRQASDLLRLCPKDFNIISGDDFTTFTMAMLGGKGVISVVANVMPGAVAKMMDALKAGNIDEARSIHFMLEELNAAMFIETNPIPVKTALAMMGKIKEEFRLPLCEMSPDNRAKLEAVMKKYELIK